MHEAALQYVRKLSGSAKPSQANAEAFDRAVGEVAAATRPAARRAGDHRPPKNREVEAAKARARVRGALRALIRASAEHAVRDRSYVLVTTRG